MYAIVDCNSFYCSCERLFRPDLQSQPVVVLSNNDGCIISRSDEAKRLGIDMGTPLFESRRRLADNHVAVFSSNYNLYGNMSMRVMDTLRILSDDVQYRCVEVYSVDEAFINLSHLPVDRLQEFAERLREVVVQWTGIPVSIGIAPSKFPFANPTCHNAGNYVDTIWYWYGCRLYESRHGIWYRKTKNRSPHTYP